MIIQQLRANANNNQPTNVNPPLHHATESQVDDMVVFEQDQQAQIIQEPSEINYNHLRITQFVQVRQNLTTALNQFIFNSSVSFGPQPESHRMRSESNWLSETLKKATATFFTKEILVLFCSYLFYIFSKIIK